MSKYKEEPYHFEDFKAESPENPEAKCLWVICIDNSYSMTPYMKDLTQGLESFKRAVEMDSVASERIEVSLVTFNHEVKVRCAPKLIDDLNVPPMTPEGHTCLVEGVERAIQVVDNRVAWYKNSFQSYYQPFIVVITDGEPNGPGDINVLSQTIQERENHPDSKQRIFFLSFGVDDADMNVLQMLTANPDSVYYVNNADFASLFKFISTSMKAVGNSSPEDKGVMKQIQDTAGDMNNFQKPV